MRTGLLALGAVLWALSQGPAVATQSGAAATPPPARVQQGSPFWAPSWREEQECLEEARQIARNAPRKTSHEQLLELAAEVCAE